MKWLLRLAVLAAVGAYGYKVWRANKKALEEEGVDPKIVAKQVLGRPEDLQCSVCGSINVELTEEGLHCEDCHTGVKFPHLPIKCPSCGAKNRVRRTEWMGPHCAVCFNPL